MMEIFKNNKNSFYTNEEFSLENEDELNELQYSGEDTAPIFQSVRVTKKDFSIYELYRKYTVKKQLILDVDFQRNTVWTPKQKCELIESILMGLPLPIFYFKQQNNSTYVVVDGKQRLSTLFEFLDNKFALKSLKILKFLNGKRFKDLIDDFGIYQSQIEDYQVYSHVILPPTPDKILFDIFDRVNRGGTKLNKQEIRNALYHGRGLNMITAIVESEEFEKATRIEHKKDSRMKGAYLITRFLAFYLLFNNLLVKEGQKYEYAGDIDDLIEITLIQLNNSLLDNLEQLAQVAIDSLKLSSEILGRGAFRRELNESKPINMNIFETTVYFMSMVVNSNKDIEKDKIKNGLRKIFCDNNFLNYIGNSRDNIIKVYGRFEMMHSLFKEINNDWKNTCTGYEVNKRFDRKMLKT